MPRYTVQKAVAILLIVSFVTPLLSQSASAAALFPAFVASVDTMKESRDPASYNGRSQEEINQEVQLIASLNVTHITVDTHYEYTDYMRKWVTAIRQTGKKIWFRPAFNQWENNNGTTGIMTPTTYLQKLDQFIRQNPDLFEEGDILDACPEPENGKYWKATFGDNWTYQPKAPNNATDEFNEFIIGLANTSDTALSAVGISGVITGIHSTNAWIGKTTSVLYPSTVAKFGVLAIDGYPESTSTDPVVAAQRRLAEIDEVYQARKIPIILSEYGYSNAMPVTDEVQRLVIKKSLEEIGKLKYITGLNYWVGPGSDTAGGYTYILRKIAGSWQKRPAANELASYFSLEVKKACASDINQDKLIDISDYSALVANFLKTGSQISVPRSDINGDGVVDISDYSAFAGKYFRTCL